MSELFLEVDRMSKRILILMAAAISLIACGGAEDSGDSPSRRDQINRAGEDFTAVIAKVGDIEITQGYFDFRYELLSAQERGRFSGEDWKNPRSLHSISAVVHPVSTLGFRW